MIPSLAEVQHLIARVEMIALVTELIAAAQSWALCDEPPPAEMVVDLETARDAAALPDDLRDQASDLLAQLLRWN